MASAELQRRTGRLTEVFHSVGRFPDGSQRLKRASYDLLEWVSVSGGTRSTYVVPLGFERITAIDLNDFIPANEAAEAIDVGSEFGFYSGDREIVEANGGDSSDSWKGLHFFGYV